MTSAAIRLFQLRKNGERLVERLHHLKLRVTLNPGEEGVMLAVQDAWRGVGGLSASAQELDHDVASLNSIVTTLSPHLESDSEYMLVAWLDRGLGDRAGAIAGTGRQVAECAKLFLQRDCEEVLIVDARALGVLHLDRQDRESDRVHIARFRITRNS